MPPSSPADPRPSGPEPTRTPAAHGDAWRVHLPVLGDELLDLPRGVFVDLARRGGVQAWLTDDPDEADLVLFTQASMLPWQRRPILEHPTRLRHRDRSIVYDPGDRPWCAMPGIYTSMPSRAFRSPFQEAWGYADIEESRFVPLRTADRDLLFSFVGSLTHRCREPLLRLRHPRGVVDRTDGFVYWDPDSPAFVARRERFDDLLGRASFVLCPRGHGTASFRLFEVMAAGRVPVIISDDWVPPIGPDWSTFTLRIAEGDLERLPALLEATEDRAVDMGRLAASTYDRWFANAVSFTRLAEAGIRIVQRSPLERFPRHGIRDSHRLRLAAAAALGGARARLARRGAA